MLVPTATCAKASLTNAYAAALRTLCLLVSGAPVLFARVVVALSFRLDAAGSRTGVVPVCGTVSVCWPRSLFAAHLTNTLLLLAAFTTTAWLSSAGTVPAPSHPLRSQQVYNRTSPVRQTRCCRRKLLGGEAHDVRCVFQRPGHARRRKTAGHNRSKRLCLS